MTLKEITMQTWAKYALSFFALILILTGFIFAFGPASTRQAYRSGEMATGQLSANHQTRSPGEPVTESGTTRAADAPAANPNAAPSK
jgi:hypothetical protein